MNEHGFIRNTVQHRALATVETACAFIALITVHFLGGCSTDERSHNILKEKENLIPIERFDNAENNSRHLAAKSGSMPCSIEFSVLDGMSMCNRAVIKHAVTDSFAASLGILAVGGDKKVNRSHQEGNSGYLQSSGRRPIENYIKRYDWPRLYKEPCGSDELRLGPIRDEKGAIVGWRSFLISAVETMNIEEPKIITIVGSPPGSYLYILLAEGDRGKFRNITSRNRGKRGAILIDDIVSSVVTIQVEIDSGIIKVPTNNIVGGLDRVRTIVRTYNTESRSGIRHR